MSEAYEDFKDRLCYDYFITADIRNIPALEKKMGMIPGNSSKEGIFCLNASKYVCFFTVFVPIYAFTVNFYYVHNFNK